MKFLLVALFAVVFGSASVAAEQGYIGLDITQVTLVDSQRLNLLMPRGVRVVAVRPDGPGLKAGILVDDVIVAYDGAQVSGYSHLVQLASAKKPGDEVSLKILRLGVERIIRVVLTTRPKNLDKPKDRVDLKGVGLSLQVLSAMVRQRQNIRSQSPGLAVVELDESGPAAKAGIRMKDVIFKINTMPVETARTFETAWAMALKSGRQKIAVHLYRAMGKVIVLVPIS